MPVKIVLVAGTRPNFIKVAPLMRALAANSTFEPMLIHTGQHYDPKLSKIFFDELRIPRPDMELEVGSATHAQQTAEIMRRFEPLLGQEQPHAVIVVGDVNSTIACSLVVAKFQLARAFQWKHGRRQRPVIIHVEAGLRSFDDDMPEEVNRKLTDVVSEVLFVSDPAGLTNLRREGAPESRVFFVGNVMVDSLLAAREQAMKSTILSQLGITEKQFCLVTLHRPSNVDDPEMLSRLMEILDAVTAPLPLVFPVHPRTQERLRAIGFKPDVKRWILTDAVGYLDFLKLEATARAVFTDSGGVQEETTVLGVPCVTLRENTERPVTIEEGTNALGGTDKETILTALQTVTGRRLDGRMPKYWDGHAADRIVGILDGLFGG
jgi:UDP-N-acetylglucosamine 2-epimerase (non-hydrolysing)